MQNKLIPVLCAVLISSCLSSPCAQIRTYTDEEMTLTAGPTSTTDSGGSGLPVTWAGNFGEGELLVEGNFSTLRTVSVLPSGFGLLVGSLKHGGDWLVVIDLSKPETYTTLWAYGFSVSPDGKRLVYNTHYPRLGTVRQSVLGELTLEPSGIKKTPIHPAVNLKQMSWAPDSKQHWRTTSPIVWTEDSQAFCFSQYSKNENSLVCFRYSSGDCTLERAETPLPIELLLEEHQTLENASIPDPGALEPAMVIKSLRIENHQFMLMPQYPERWKNRSAQALPIGSLNCVREGESR